MSPPIPLPLGDATTTMRGIMTPAHVLALAANTGDLTLAAVGSVPNANGASLAGQALTLQPANASFGGAVSTAAQTFAGLKTFRDGIIAASLLGAGGADVCHKIGTSVADASVSSGAKLLSLRSGLGGTETEYAYFIKPVSGGLGGVLTVDSKSASNEFGLDLRGQGAGVNGIGFGSADGSYIGVGNGYLDQSMINRLFRFSYNSAGFSSSPNAGYDFGGTALSVPFMRLAANASHTGKLISALLGASEKFYVDSAGSMFNAGNLTVGSGVILNGNTGVGSFGGSLTFGTAGAIEPFLQSMQVSALSKPMIIYATGTSGITETVRALGSRADAGLKCFVAGTENGSPNAGAILFQAAYGISTAANDAGNGTAVFRIYADGKIGVSGAAAATAVGAVAKKLQIYDAAGTSLGFIPIYSSIT